MQRLRLKADGRIVELRDGQEFPLAPASIPAAPAEAAPPVVRDLRRRARLTQLEFAARLGRAGRDHPQLGAGQTHAARTGAGAARRDRPRPRDGVCRLGQSLSTIRLERRSEPEPLAAMLAARSASGT